MENIYPRLYLYCKQRGYDFRMVDLRLGVGTPVAERHDTVELHMENLQRCQETLGPNFIVRYHCVVLFDSARVQQNRQTESLCFRWFSFFWSVVCRTEVWGPEPSLDHDQRGLWGHSESSGERTTANVQEQTSGGLSCLRLPVQHHCRQQLWQFFPGFHLRELSKFWRTCYILRTAEPELPRFIFRRRGGQTQPWGCKEPGGCRQRPNITPDVLQDGREFPSSCLPLTFHQVKTKSPVTVYGVVSDHVLIYSHTIRVFGFQFLNPIKRTAMSVSQSIRFMTGIFSPDILCPQRINPTGFSDPPSNHEVDIFETFQQLPWNLVQTSILPRGYTYDFDDLLLVSTTSSPHFSIIQWNSSTPITWIGKKNGTGIHGSQRMNPNDLSETLALYLVLPSASIFLFHVKMSQQLLVEFPWNMAQTFMLPIESPELWPSDTIRSTFQYVQYFDLWTDTS